MQHSNLFEKGTNLTSLHFWDAERSIHVITNKVKLAIERMQWIYPGINVSKATGQPNEPQDNQVQLNF